LTDPVDLNDTNYLDNRFLDLKMHHFVNSDYNAEKNLVLWGAGKKAKKIASSLQEEEINFRWICNNPKKIGKEIYGVILESEKVINQIPNAQLIVAIANPSEQADIKNRLGTIGDCEVYFFC